MHGGGVNKLETGVQILEMFQGADLVLLTKTWHFPNQQLPHVEGFDSLAIARTVQLGRTKSIKHSGGVIAYFRSHLSPNLSQWKEGNHDSYLWLRVNMSVAPDLFVCMVYVAPIGSKHESESLFQNLARDIIKVQTLGGIVLMGGDFNARTAALSNTIDINDLCELLQAPELARIEQPNIVTKQQNRDVGVNGWGRELLNLCCDVGLLIVNGRTPTDELGEFICLANGGRNTIDYIVSSLAIWQAVTHLEVIIDDTRYCAVGGESDHMPLRLQLNINCTFVEPQHIAVTKKFLPRFKYDKSKVEQYQLALTTSLGNLWVANSIGHLGVDGVTDLLQQCVGAAAKSTFGSKLSRGRCKMRHCHKPWFDADCHIAKRELRLWLKANHDSHVAKHQQSNFKKLLKRKKKCWEIARARHMCTLAKVDAHSFWKKYRPRAPVVDKISAITLLEGFRELFGQFSPPI
jgi:hypothetical protein